MARSKHALNVSPTERAMMRTLYGAGLTIPAIQRRMKRSERAVARAVRGVTRSGPRWRHSRKRAAALLARNNRIAELRREGLTVQAIAIEVGLTMRRINQLLGAPQRSRAKPRRAAKSETTPKAAKLTQAQRLRRNRKIVRLRREGVPTSLLARRYGISPDMVGKIVAAASS